MKRLKWLGLSGVICGAMLFGCRAEETFPDLGSKVASPADIAQSKDGSVFYALNADFDRTYNAGSILVVDQDGKKLRAVGAPRLGRFLVTAGDDMLVGFDSADEESKEAIYLYDISTPSKPVLKKVWDDIGCSPLNAVIRNGYDHFAVSCIFGDLFVGTLAADRSKSTLKKVREYKYSRRAMFLDPHRELLMGFTTILGAQSLDDSEEYDRETWNDEIQKVKVDGEDVGNEVPDEFENSRADQRKLGRQYRYQFFIYDIAAERSSGFKLKEVTEDAVKNELRWMYFKVTNFDGTPDPGTSQSADVNYYRTNFWAARPDPTDINSFYLSHRGPPTNTGSPHANHIIKVTMKGDVKVNAETGKKPKTRDVFLFERVYGFNGEQNSKFKYPGDFQVSLVGGKKLLVVNHFRDLVHWDRDDVYYSLVAQSLDGSLWIGETETNTDPELSWFQFEMNSEGRGIAASYYGNRLLRFDLTPGVGFSNITTVK